MLQKIQLYISNFTVRPPPWIVIDHVFAGVQFLLEFVDTVAFRKAAGKSRDDDVFGLKAKFVGQHVRFNAGFVGVGCHYVGKLTVTKKNRKLSKRFCVCRLR